MSTDAKWLLAFILSAVFGIVAIFAALTNIIPAEQLFLYACVGFVVGVLLILYELPAIIAYKRDHRRFLAILLLNILLGWTILGWIGAFIWSCVSESKPIEVPYSPVKFPRRARRTRTLRVRFRSIQIMHRPDGDRRDYAA
jgi:hypothetical protein